MSWKVFGFLFWIVLVWVWLQELAISNTVTGWWTSVQRWQTSVRERVQQDKFQREANICYILAPRVRGHSNNCGMSPNGAVRCCGDATLQFVVQYDGNASPYEHARVAYHEICR
jgi:hypothetical protein